MATGNVDWADLRRRLSESIEATETSQRMSGERAKAILRERAQALARTEDRDEGIRTLGVVAFRLGRERYAIETGFVREVVRITELTSVPGTPEGLLGVVNLRGEILPVVELRKMMNVPVKGLTDLSRIVVLGVERPEFGLLAAVDAVEDLRIDDLGAVPEGRAAESGEFIRGVTPDGRVVLDGGALLTSPRFFWGGRNGNGSERGNQE